jgi:hypothetical protein
LAAAAKDPDQVTDLLDELSRGRLWLPLPDASPVTDGSAVLLPTVTYLGAEFVPAFTSAERLAGWPGRMAVPEGVTYLAAAVVIAEGTQVRVGRPPADPVPLLSEARMALGAVPSVRQASRAWLSVPGQGEGLVISVTLDDPGSETAHSDVLSAIERAVQHGPGQEFPIDVTFPGEGEPDQVDTWITAHAEPFYIRA